MTLSPNAQLVLAARTLSERRVSVTELATRTCLTRGQVRGALNEIHKQGANMRRAQTTLDLARLAESSDTGSHLPGFEPRHGNRKREVVESPDSNGFLPTRYDDVAQPRIVEARPVTITEKPYVRIGSPNAQPAGRTATGSAVGGAGKKKNK